MLPFKNRLTKREDFRKVYQRGTFVFTSNLSLKVTPNSLSDTRIGFPVEKKYFPKAVERNQMKRKLREAVRPYLKRIKPGFDVVIFCRKVKKIKNFSQLLSEMEELLKKSNLI